MVLRKIIIVEGFTGCREDDVGAHLINKVISRAFEVLNARDGFAFDLRA
jgi:hypothetical protein